LQFFVKHFLEAYRGASLTASEREALERRTAAGIAEELAPLSRECSVIRDYHKPQSDAAR
jgi:hypothetical protein